jgi:hypothetical protein
MRTVIGARNIECNAPLSLLIGLLLIVSSSVVVGCECQSERSVSYETLEGTHSAADMEIQESEYSSTSSTLSYSSQKQITDETTDECKRDVELNQTDTTAIFRDGELFYEQAEVVDAQNRYVGRISAYRINESYQGRLLISDRRGDTVVDAVVPPAYKLFILESGKYVLYGWPTYGDHSGYPINIHIYDAAGQMIKEYDGIYTPAVSFLSIENGNYFAMVTERLYEPYIKPHVVELTLFDGSFNELWKKTYDNLSFGGGQVMYNPDDRKVILVAAEGNQFEDIQTLPVRYEYNLRGELIVKHTE